MKPLPLIATRLRWLPRLLVGVLVSGSMLSLGSSTAFARQGPPTNNGRTTMHVTLSAKQLSDFTAKAWAHDTVYVEQLRLSGTAAAARIAHSIESRYASAAARAALSPRGQTLDIPMAVLGRNHAPGRIQPQAPAGTQPGYGVWTYKVGDSGDMVQSDPVTHFIAPYPGFDGSLGSAMTVHGLVEGPSSALPWFDASGEYQAIWGCVDINTGACRFIDPSYQVQWPGPDGNPTQPRDHARLFEVVLADGDFTVVAAHHDSNHICTDDWTGARFLFQYSIPQADILSAGSQDDGNAGYVPCPPGYSPAYWDGQEADIWLGAAN